MKFLPNPPARSRKKPPGVGRRMEVGTMLRLNDDELNIILSALDRERSELQSRLEESTEEGIQHLLNDGMSDLKEFMDMIGKGAVDISIRDALIAKIAAEADS